MNLRRFGFIALIIIILIGIVVLVGKDEVSPSTIIVSMLATTIAVATPLTLGAISGIYCERAGVVNIGRTLSVNPGSEYGEGVLRGCLLSLARDEVKNYQLTAG